MSKDGQNVFDQQFIDKTSQVYSELVGQRPAFYEPPQYATAQRPLYKKGGVYFDLTLNKLVVCGATTFETITSV